MLLCSPEPIPWSGQEGRNLILLSTLDYTYFPHSLRLSSNDSPFHQMGLKISSSSSSESSSSSFRTRSWLACTDADDIMDAGGGPADRSGPSASSSCPPENISKAVVKRRSALTRPPRCGCCLWTEFMGRLEALLLVGPPPPEPPFA